MVVHWRGLGLLSTELHTWTLLSTRSVTGCALGANATVPANATAASCAAAGYFDCSPSLTVTTAPPAPWVSGLFCMLLVVVLYWLGVSWIIAMQNWRASALLPHHILVRVRSFNGAFYGVAVALTSLYIWLKYATFSAQPRALQLRCGPGGGAAITAALSEVFASVGAVGQGGLVTLGASLLTLWLSFSAVSSQVSRYAHDALADVTITSLLVCEGAGGGGAPCDSHDGQPDSPLLRALRGRFLRVESAALDGALKAWFEARGLRARGHAWGQARWLRGCDAGLVADAAAFVKGAQGGLLVQ